MAVPVRVADPAELESWDARVVEVPGGNVYQSRAWAAHRARLGWTPHFLVLDDGFPVLALTRPWRGLAGSSAYVSRGPIPAADARTTADRLVAVTAWLGDRGCDVVAADPEVPADSGFPELLRGAGFHQIEEIQPTRHRLDLAVPPSGDEGTVFGAFSSTTRNLIRQAERQGLTVRRVEGGVGDPTEREACEVLYGFLRETSTRRGFWLASRSTFMSWMTAALAAHLAFLLVVEDGDGQPVAAASFHRHGERLTYALAGERTEARRSHPGANRLLVWRAIQVAMAEGRTVMDLSGVDVRGARRRPRPGEPEQGMLQFKESFGARWVEMSGAHERVLRPGRYLAGRVIDRLTRGLGGSHP